MAPFYKRVLSSSLMCAARAHYPGVGFPMELWGTPAQMVYDKTLRRYPFFDSTDEERQTLFAAASSPPIWVHPSCATASRAIDARWQASAASCGVTDRAMGVGGLVTGRLILTPACGGFWPMALATAFSRRWSSSILRMVLIFPYAGRSGLIKKRDQRRRVAKTLS